MARYRKIEVALWTDERFRALSAAQANGQTLWMYLLSGPRTTTFPGLVVAREAVMADDLGWSVSAFREAFNEASREGLVEADWKTGVVVLRKALLDSAGEPRESARPESPNVLRGWARSWIEIPECDLKSQYLRTLGSFAEGLGRAFHEAFTEAFRKALTKASPHPSPNQDQDQDQDQDREREAPSAPSQPPTKPRKRRARGTGSSLPADWKPNDAHLGSCHERSLNADLEAQKFRNNALAKGLEYVDWDAAFRTWLMRSAEFRDAREPANRDQIRFIPRLG